MIQPNQSPRPLWVHFALWGVPGRTAALCLAALSVLLGLSSSVYAVAAGNWPWLLPTPFMWIAGGWYWKAVRWIDENDRWD